MEKLAVGPDVDPRRISLDFSVAHNLEAIANCLGKPVGDVTVLVLDRPRHAKLIQEIRAAGARIRMISDGDVGGAIETAKPEAPVDVMMGIGGTPETLAFCVVPGTSELEPHDLGFNEAHDLGFNEAHDLGFNEAHDLGFNEPHDL
eukprot:gene11430-11576_t